MRVQNYTEHVESAEAWLAAPVHRLDAIDSTNNYAMALLDAGKGQAGTTVVARRQVTGKGQRGKVWIDQPGKSLLMSMIVSPAWGLDDRFLLSAAAALAVAEAVQCLAPLAGVHIKWPNDIIIHDKKAAGILIENQLRGSQWLWAVVGIGLNVAQEYFPPELPCATSLCLEGAEHADVARALQFVRELVAHELARPRPRQELMACYNARLYHCGKEQNFRSPDGIEPWTILSALPDGCLSLRRHSGEEKIISHGELEWMWGGESLNR